MKRVLLFLSFILTIYISATAQNKFNEDQLNLRKDIEKFLREEGFMPEIDSDGDITFKKEGNKYYVIIDNRDTSPLYLSLSQFYNYNGKNDKLNISKNLETLNLKKGVKTLLYENHYTIQAEMYIVNAESFKYAFYKLIQQLEYLQNDVNKLLSNNSSSNSGGVINQGSNGSYLINENFSSYSSRWKKSDGDLSFQNGKMIFEDLEDSGYSKLLLNLPRNLKNEDFQLTFSLKTIFKKRYASLNFIVGKDWYNSYWLGFTTWDDEKIILSYGPGGDVTKYYGYSDAANLSTSVMHQYKMIKRGEKVEWYADGKYLFSTTIDSSIDMNIIGFLVANYHKIEVDNVSIKLL